MRIVNANDYSYFLPSATTRSIQAGDHHDTLTSYPFALLMERLFDEAEASSPATNPAFAGVSSEERARLMRSKTDYRAFYGHLKDFPLARLPRDRHAALHAGAQHRRADDRRVRDLVRHLDPAPRRGLRDNGGGRLITSEFEPSKVARARDNLTAGGLIDLVEIREGDARRR